ncbi:MAG: hypothetical protein N2510_02920 [Ignavibacteria bacterium]|nr:hypothetical protein [Ignavibacteria bacterium]
MSDKNKNKNKEKKEAERIRKKLESLQICPYCQRMVEFIWVHGHYQCPRCGNVIIGCCGDI